MAVSFTMLVNNTSKHVATNYNITSKQESIFTRIENLLFAEVGRSERNKNKVKK